MNTLYEKHKRGRRDAADAAYIDEIEPPARGRRFVVDAHRDAPRGFALRVDANGRRSFCLRYKADGRDRLISVGAYPTWSLAAARKQAQTLRREIDGGTDILEDRRERRAALTVRDAVERYCKHHADRLTSGRAVRRTLERHLVPALGTKKLAAVRKRDVIDVVEKLAHEHGRQAALLLTYTKGVFAWAEEREYVDVNPVASIIPRKVDRRLKPRKRGRVLGADEIRALWNRAAPPDGMDALTLAALQLVLVTGQRPGEVAGMRWADVDARNTWTIPAAHRLKSEEAHAVPLTRSALDVLERLRETARQGAAHVFERKRGQPIDVNALNKAVRGCWGALQNANDPDESHWRPHDLRRTTRTGLSAAGVSEEVAERVIGHAKRGMTAVYNRHEYVLEKRAALEAWERRLATIARGEDPDAERADVISIDAGRRPEATA